MKLRVESTIRGFAVAEFDDHYGVRCSIQDSSLASDACIWLGCNEADPKVMVWGKGWVSHPMPDGYQANTRMHLTQEQAAALLPLLERFVRAGTIRPAETQEAAD